MLLTITFESIPGWIEGRDREVNRHVVLGGGHPTPRLGQQDQEGLGQKENDARAEW